MAKKNQFLSTRFPARLTQSAGAILILSAIAFFLESNANGQSAKSRDGKSTVNGEVADSEPADQSGKSSTNEQPIADSNPTRFLRVEIGKNSNPVALQTAITRYQRENSELIVDLVSAVHIGEASYYRRLSDQFSNYDVVLYELVAPDHAPRPDGNPRSTSGNPVGFLQQSAKSLLGLESQLEQIDYRKSNFVHADLSPTEMSEKMSDRGESAMSIGLSTLAELMERQPTTEQNDQVLSQFENIGLVELLNDPVKLKQMMAIQFAQEGVMEMGLGQKLNRLLINDRNEEAIRVLRKQITAGKKHISIFYGAAHMPDFEHRLVSELGFKRTDQVWLTAWDLTLANSEGTVPGIRLLKWLSEIE